MLKAGTLIDATLVEAAVARPPLSEGEVSTKDPEAGIIDGILHRGHARRPLAAWQRWMNTALAPIRGQVVLCTFRFGHSARGTGPVTEPVPF